MSSPFPSPRSRPGSLVDFARAEGCPAEAVADRHGGLGPRPIRPSPGGLNRSERTPLAFRCAAAAAILLVGACGRDAPGRVAGRVLEHYRKTAALRPRPE